MTSHENVFKSEKKRVRGIWLYIYKRSVVCTKKIYINLFRQTFLWDWFVWKNKKQKNLKKNKKSLLDRRKEKKRRNRMFVSNKRNAIEIESCQWWSEPLHTKRDTIFQNKVKKRRNRWWNNRVPSLTSASYIFCSRLTRTRTFSLSSYFIKRNDVILGPVQMAVEPLCAVLYKHNHLVRTFLFSRPIFLLIC